MENEKGFYVALGVYIGELQKRTDLKMTKYARAYTSATLLLMI